jgi:hypothetical protein
MDGESLLLIANAAKEYPVIQRDRISVWNPTALCATLTNVCMRRKTNIAMPASIAPRLSEYMGWSVFEEICGQWLHRNAQQRLGLNVREMARYGSWDGRTEIDLMAELDDGTFLFGECKWRTESVTRLNDLSVLQAKVVSLPEARWRNKPSYILFALGGFSPEPEQLAADPAERLYLVRELDMLGKPNAR